jgi:hypothetical protein
MFPLLSTSTKLARFSFAAPGPDFESYADALKDYITKNGPANLGVLGGKVKRPANIPKLKKFLETRSDFAIDAKGVVSVV